MSSDDYKRFESLTYDDFRRMAGDVSLSKYEKIGFPDSYRKGKEQSIFEDIVRKLPLLEAHNRVVVDIGPGCSELPLMLIELCRRQGHKLILVDCEEMLSQLPDEPFIQKIAGYYPDCFELLQQYVGRVGVCLSYSVLHYIFTESNVETFLDRSLELLAPASQMLIGDIPNLSKRNRFFSSPTGIKFHQEFTGRNDLPPMVSKTNANSGIDDEVVLSLITRARKAGFDAYVVPQADDLPMANRREDILITRP